MKSEERHRLQENELEKFSQKVGLWFEQHGQVAAIAAVAVVLLIAVGIYAARTWTATDTTGWAELEQAVDTGDPEELATLAGKYSGSPVGAWALLQSAELRLQDAVYLQFTDREAGQTELEQAEQDFRAVAAREAAPDDARERALYGLASALEAQAEPKEAIEVYQRLLSEFPETPYQPVVERRLAQLQSEEAAEFYAWFEQQTPTIRDREMPDDGTNPFAEPPEDTGTEDTEGGPSLVPPADTEPPAEDTTPTENGESPTGEAEPQPKDTEKPAPGDEPAPAEEKPALKEEPADDAKPTPDDDAKPADGAKKDAESSEEPAADPEKTPEDSEPAPSDN